MRAIYDAYAAGLNHYLARHPEVKPLLLRRFEPWYPLALMRFKYHQGEFLDYAGLDFAALRFVNQHRRKPRARTPGPWLRARAPRGVPSS